MKFCPVGGVLMRFLCHEDDFIVLVDRNGNMLKFDEADILFFDNECDSWNEAEELYGQRN